MIFNFKYKYTLIVIIIIIKKCENADFKFPDKFIIGSASSAYQIEGAWNIDGKSESNWDRFVHTQPYKIEDGSNGDVACDSYHKFKKDIKMLKDIGLDHYRFSISWSRILPKGYAFEINEEGLRYYHSILDELEKLQIIPIVTIYHWDHPQNLEDDFGGWLNEEMAFVYADYARVIFAEFGHRVKWFVTVNEPQIFCEAAYRGVYPPGLSMPGVGAYECLHNKLKAHALAYHIYDDAFRLAQGGKVGYVMQCANHFSKNKTDHESSDIAYEFECGWQAHPVFSREGDYPEIMKQRVAERSKLQGYERSRLPTFSQYWIDYIRGSADFFGLNYYTSDIVAPLPMSSILEWPTDDGLKHTKSPEWATAESPWLKIVPEGLGDLLRIIKKKYDNPLLIITENGVSDGNGTDDTLRLSYLYSHMKEIAIAIERDKCNIRGYTIWSLLDDFEWNFGYKDHFGLIQVDFNDPNLKRTPKMSTVWLKTVMETRVLIPPANESELLLHYKQDTNSSSNP